MLNNAVTDQSLQLLFFVPLLRLIHCVLNTQYSDSFLLLLLSKTSSSLVVMQRTPSRILPHLKYLHFMTIDSQYYE